MWTRERSRGEALRRWIIESEKSVGLQTRSTLTRLSLLCQNLGSADSVTAVLTRSAGGRAYIPPSKLSLPIAYTC